MVPGCAAQPSLRVLDDVVRGGSDVAAHLLHLDEGEEHAVSDEFVEGVRGLAQALAGVELLAVLDGELPEERFPPRALSVMLGEPHFGRVGVFGLL